jgi:hypothetical protein
MTHIALPPHSNAHDQLFDSVHVPKSIYGARSLAPLHRPPLSGTPSLMAFFLNVATSLSGRRWTSPDPGQDWLAEAMAQ